MGHDSSEGTLRLDRSGEVVLSWRNRWQSHLYRSQRRVGPLLARLLEARLHHPVTWSVLRRTTTVHPLGGVRPGPDATTGVVDDLGEVHGHPGLFIIDGSTVPASTGVNPSATILAAAERSVEAIIRRERHPEWRAPEWRTMTPTPAPEDSASAFSAELKTATSGGGIAFRERMTSRTSERPTVTMRLAVEARSIDRFLADPDHVLTVEGAIDIDGIAASAPTTGTLSLFPEGGAEAMRYALSFLDSAAQEWTLTGTKVIASRAPWHLVRDLTRLRASVRVSDSTAPIVTTTLHISRRDLVKLAMSLRGAGFTRARRVRTLGRFVAFFARSAAKKALHPSA